MSGIIIMIIVGVIYFIVLAIEYKFMYIHLIIALIALFFTYNTFLEYEMRKLSIIYSVAWFFIAIYSVYRFVKIKNKIQRIKINVLEILNKKGSIDDNIIDLLQIGEVSSQELVTILKSLMKKGEIPYIYDIDKYYNLTK